MFERESKKRIPKALNECTETPNTVKQLHMWADLLERWGQIVFYILIVAGFVTTIVDVITLIDYEEELIFSTVVSDAISWTLYTLIEFFTYNALVLLINALALIVHNTSIAANVALYESSKNSSTSSEPAQSKSGGSVHASYKSGTKNEWKCTCGKVNPSYISTCTCGIGRINVQLTATKSETPSTSIRNEDGSWKCGKCGKTNLNTRNTCWACNSQK